MSLPNILQLAHGNWSIAAFHQYFIGSLATSSPDGFIHHNQTVDVEYSRLEIHTTPYHSSNYVDLFTIQARIDW